MVHFARERAAEEKDEAGHKPDQECARRAAHKTTADRERRTLAVRPSRLEFQHEVNLTWGEDQ